MNTNSIMTISPWREHGTWMFDDERVGLEREPFVDDVNWYIDKVCDHAGLISPEEGISLLFSPNPFPGSDIGSTWLEVDEELGGNWYSMGDTGVSGWLCPSLFHYFDEAPEKIYISVRKN
jgi:hypothetical protein